MRRSDAVGPRVTTELTPAVAAGPSTTGPRAKGESPTTGHLPALDGIRGVAIAMVLVFHVGQFGQAVIGHSSTASKVERALLLLTNHGWLGVDLFFALSGFLITGILTDAKGRPNYLRTFFGRRALRIFPLYYAALLILLVISVRLHDPVEVRRAGAWAWVYLINVKMVVSGPETVSAMLHHFWSLGVEEQFYLAWPFLVLLSTRIGMMRICVGSFLLSIVLRHALTAHLPGPTGFLMPARLDALAAGGWVALALRGPFDEQRARRYALWTALGAGACLAALLAASLRNVVIPHVDLEEASVPPAALLFAAMIAMAVLARSGRVARLFSAAAPRFLGRYSYAIYVFHQPLTILILRAAVFQRAVTVTGSRLSVYALLFSSVSAAAIGCALVSWHAWEKHFLRLKSRVTYATALPDAR